jgi:LPS-assembly protein
MKRVGTRIAGLAITTALFCAAGSFGVSAQPQFMPNLTAPTASGQDRLLVDAKEIVYDNDRNTVSASGDVQLTFQGRSLQADRVTYDRTSGRVYAAGNARLTSPDGSVVTGDRFELTDDFKNGFIDSLRLVQPTVENGAPVTARFSAPRAERTGGETTVFERGTYTTCEPCKNNPERPPFWQVKAARIIHNNAEKTIYYENASLEFLGVPIAYVPYFWTPDPTVKRKTGFLSPRFVISNSLGFGVSAPFFWAPEPNYDLTITPTILSRQGVLGQAEWRHRLLNGSYSVRAAGIFQLDPGAFLPAPLGPGNRDFRGSLESSGLFYINDRWKFGWNATLLTDRWFLSNYHIPSSTVSTFYTRESISTAFLQGLGDRSFFDLRGYYFQGLSTFDFQKQQPVVHPVFDYDRRFNGPGALGGEIGLNVNVTSLTREAAQFEEIPNQVAKYGIFDTCSVFMRGQCLVRGISGTTSRASVDLSWRRQFIDGLGQSWTPFAYARADGFWIEPSFSGYQNANLRNFIGEDDGAARFMPAIGLEYRFPLVASLGPSLTQVVEPIAQVIARPNEARIGRLPNEDAQSLVFDDTSIFDWDKFTGYDRVEGGVRANLGAQYTVTGAGGFSADALVGQSFHLAGLNSFTPGDIANVGRDSGLESDRSDFVGRLRVSPNKNLSFFTRGRFDESDFSMRRLEAGATINLDPLLPVSGTFLYANYAPQKELGFERGREGFLAAAKWNITPNWHVSSSIVLDLDRSISPTKTSSGGLDVASFGFGLGYADECTILTVNYSVAPKSIAITAGEKEVAQTVMFRLELRTLGELGYQYSFGPAANAGEGVAAR